MNVVPGLSGNHGLVTPETKGAAAACAEPQTMQTSTVARSVRMEEVFPFRAITRRLPRPSSRSTPAERTSWRGWTCGRRSPTTRSTGRWSVGKLQQLLNRCPVPRRCSAAEVLPREQGPQLRPCDRVRVPGVDLTPGDHDALARRGRLLDAPHDLA